MMWYWAIGSLLMFEAQRARNKVLGTLASMPPYDVTGPLVSVIIPTYNEEKYLPALINALNNQTYDNLELIVVDNASEDRTVEIARSTGATVIVNEEYNLSKSRNMGANVSTGSILVFIDADTIPESIAIEKTIEAIDNGYVLVSINRCSSDDYVQNLLRVTIGWILPNGQINGQFIGVTKEAFESVGGFDETCLPQEYCGEDVDFIQRVRQEYPDGTTYLRTTYAGTSARRQIKEGYLVKHHWGDRAIRGFLE